MSDMLKIINATLRFDAHLLFNNYTFEVPKGEWVCLTGESGCGKTSLLKAIMGFLPLEHGTVEIMGIKMQSSTIDELRRHIAYVPQELNIPNEWVSDTLKMPFDYKANRVTSFDWEGLLSIWKELGLDSDLVHRRSSQLSGGQRQRIMLSLAVLLNKPLIIADEPTSALDADSVDRVARLFKRVAAQGRTVITTTHNPLLLQWCDRVVKI